MLVLALHIIYWHYVSFIGTNNRTVFVMVKAITIDMETLVVVVVLQALPQPRRFASDPRVCCTGV